jgi:Sec-independent protein translocase protein TatA
VTTSLALLDIGPFEFVLLAAAAVLLFGGDLPDVARKTARFLGKLRSLSSDLSQELQKTPHDLRPPSELQRPPELDRPPELGLDAADKDLFGKANPTPPPVDADWRPKSHEPFPDVAPGSAAGEDVASAPANPDQPTTEGESGSAGDAPGAPDQPVAHDDAPAPTEQGQPLAHDDAPAPTEPGQPVAHGDASASAEPSASVSPSEPDASAEPDVLVDRREDQPPV